MENAGIFYGHLEHFTVIWYILLPFGNVLVIWYIFPPFGILCEEKSGNPDRHPKTEPTFRSRLFPASLGLQERRRGDVGPVPDPLVNF
jgi:hypothetical protein